MGLALDKIVGGGAGDIVKRTAGGREQFLSGRADEILGSRGFAEASNLRLDAIRSLKFGRPGERRTAIGSAAADVGQRVSVGPGTGAFANATRRAQGLTRITGATGRDFDSQLLRDRISAVGRGVQRQGLGQRIAASGLGIRDSVLNTERQARVASGNVFQNALGGLTGAAAAGASNIFSSREGVKKAESKGQETPGFAARFFGATA